MDLSRTAYVILGMLKLGCRTGYDIKGLVDVSTRFFWAASYGQIYPELARLEDLGLVEGQEDRTDGRRRRTYQLTPAGERALRDWLSASEPLHVELRHEGMLKLFFSDALEPKERLEVVRRMRAEHEQLAARLSEIEPAARAARGEDHRMPYLTLELGMELQAFYVEWCDRAERRLAEEIAALEEA
jgi:PadR family transcriptional regulator AphA